MCSCGILEEIVRHGSNPETKALFTEKVGTAPLSNIFLFAIALFVEFAIHLKMHETDTGCNKISIKPEFMVPASAIPAALEAKQACWTQGLKKIATVSIYAMLVLGTRRRGV